jgi:N-acetylneuraminate synthase
MNFQIGRLNVSNERCTIIAEIGNNHNGDFERAIALVDQAQSIGVDCVKFQMRVLDQVYRKKTLARSGEDLSTEYVVDLLEKFELSPDEHYRLFDYCQKIGIEYLCTPWDLESTRILESFGVPGYKISSADLTNLPLIDAVARTQKPLILSTGMSYFDEVKKTVAFLQKHNANFALLHCNSTYPAPLQDINLNWMSRLKELHPLVGYSGHERGIAVSLAARALGACIIERHFTLDREMEGPDHAASLEFNDFDALVKGLRDIEMALGSSEERVLSQGEIINRENLSKSLIASRPLKLGTVLAPEDISVRSPGQGLSPQCYESLLGKILHRDMEEEDFFYQTDLHETVIEPKNYSFDRPWGIPVRYHDFQKFHTFVQPDFFEFHFSYSDMSLDPADFLHGEYDCDFVVHAPELFSGSHLMDLATPDDSYRQQSLQETQRIIDITRALKKYFPRTKRPMIVANIGGFTMDQPIAKQEHEAYYRRFAESLKALDLQGVELIPQTMAPFPWHFGGQRYQNLFVELDEIIEWCEKLNIRLCYDVSHSALTCAAYGVDIYDFSAKISPYVAHLHLADAKGVNGEGLQIGEGDLDFTRLNEILHQGCPQASFIPEIWQGHKNNGEGFFIALDKLEQLTR